MYALVELTFSIIKPQSKIFNQLPWFEAFGIIVEFDDVTVLIIDGLGVIKLSVANVDPHETEHEELVSVVVDMADTRGVADSNIVFLEVIISDVFLPVVFTIAVSELLNVSTVDVSVDVWVVSVADWVIEFSSISFLEPKKLQSWKSNLYYLI